MHLLFSCKGVARRFGAAPPPPRISVGWGSCPCASQRSAWPSDAAIPDRVLCQACFLIQMIFASCSQFQEPLPGPAQAAQLLLPSSSGQAAGSCRGASTTPLLLCAFSFSRPALIGCWRAFSSSRRIYCRLFVGPMHGAMQSSRKTWLSPDRQALPPTRQAANRFLIPKTLNFQMFSVVFEFCVHGTDEGTLPPCGLWATHGWHPNSLAHNSGRRHTSRMLAQIMSANLCSVCVHSIFPCSVRSVCTVLREALKLFRSPKWFICCKNKVCSTTN